MIAYWATGYLYKKKIMIIEFEDIVEIEETGEIYVAKTIIGNRKVILTKVNDNSKKLTLISFTSKINHHKKQTTMYEESK